MQHWDVRMLRGDWREMRCVGCCELSNALKHGHDMSHGQLCLREEPC